MIATLLLLALTQVPADKDFAAANELALKGDYTSAIALYEGLVSRGVTHEDLYLNLGNAYAESGRTVDAVVAWERALRLAPEDEDVKANLTFMRARAVKNTAPADTTGDVSLADAIEPFIAGLRAQTFLWLAIVANAILFGALLMRRFVRSQRRAATIAAGVAFAVLISASAIVVGHVVVARDPRAVVMEGVDLKEGPHERFKNSGRLIPGARVRVLEEEGSFSRVLREDGSIGWAPSRSLTRV